MPNSMTGFGRAEQNLQPVVVTAEIRSVNNRYLNVRMRVPARFARLESKLEEEVRRRVARGSVDVTVRVRGRSTGDRAVLDKDLAQAWLTSIQELARSSGLSTDVKLESLLSLPGVVVLEEEDDATDVEVKAVTQALRGAVTALAEMRAAEGQRLSTELLKILARVEKQVDSIAKRSRQVPARIRQRYLDRIQALLGASPELDPGALEREVAILADRADVAEELARLRSHCEEFRATLAKRGAIGRSLDFLVQELAREANTVASKNQDVEIGRKVIDMRSNIDRLREQVQNVE